MATLSPITIGEKTAYVFSSESIKVYPCSSRGIQSQGIASYDPEARLNTENNFVKLGGQNKTTIAEWYKFYENAITGSYLKCYINGYYILITDFNKSSFSSLTSTDYSLCILTKSVPLVGSATTNILASFSGNNDLDNNGTFYGVVLIKDTD